MQKRCTFHALSTGKVVITGWIYRLITGISIHFSNFS